MSMYRWQAGYPKANPRLLTGVADGEGGSLGEYAQNYSVFGRWQVADSFSQLATEDFADRLFDWLGLVPDTGSVPGKKRHKTFKSMCAMRR